jgi:glycerol-3-phosphate dehydrogenase
MSDIEDLVTGPKLKDVIIVGAGCVGASIARALCKYESLSVLVIERESDVSQGASKANSGIVHGGYDSKGTWKARLEFEGNQMFEEVCNELSVPFKRVGSLVLSFTARDDEELEKLFRNGKLNGVSNLEFWDREKILLEEPHVSIGVRRALYCPHAGITNPYLYTIANCENAIENGAEFLLSTKVLKITRKNKYFEVLVEDRATRQQDIYRAKKVVNCAGVYSDTLSETREFDIHPRRGEYVILSREQGQMANRVLFQAPTARWGKGVLVSPTVDGNLLIGPSASDIPERENKDTTFQELAYIAWAARRSVPHLDTRAAIRSFAGIRAKSSTGDFVIAEKDGFVNAAGIDSPGLTSSPAIAKRVVELLKITSKIKRNWTPTRTPYDASTLTARQGGGELLFEHSHPELNIICRCETVTESTIVDSLRRGIKIQCTDSVKWRTRAGMGECGGARCRPLVCQLIAKEQGLAHPENVPKQVIGQEIPQRLMKYELGRL